MTLPRPPTADGIIADKAYDTNALREMIEEADVRVRQRCGTTL
jgi:hypothetical protein